MIMNSDNLKKFREAVKLNSVSKIMINGKQFYCYNLDSSRIIESDNIPIGTLYHDADGRTYIFTEEGFEVLLK